MAGHADHECAIAGINEAGLFQYLEKPWDDAQLLLVIRAGVERARLLREFEDFGARFGVLHLGGRAAAAGAVLIWS
jgi:two-component system response regulator HupR/HoxA